MLSPTDGGVNMERTEEKIRRDGLSEMENAMQ